MYKANILQFNWLTKFQRTFFNVKLDKLNYFCESVCLFPFGTNLRVGHSLGHMNFNEIERQNHTLQAGSKESNALCIGSFLSWDLQFHFTSGVWKACIFGLSSVSRQRCSIRHKQSEGKKTHIFLFQEEMISKQSKQSSKNI